jgi:hypothetical protein
MRHLPTGPAAVGRWPLGVERLHIDQIRQEELRIQLMSMLTLFAGVMDNKCVNGIHDQSFTTNAIPAGQNLGCRTEVG